MIKTCIVTQLKTYCERNISNICLKIDQKSTTLSSPILMIRKLTNRILHQRRGTLDGQPTTKKNELNKTKEVVFFCIPTFVKVLTWLKDIVLSMHRKEGEVLVLYANQLVQNHTNGFLKIVGCEGCMAWLWEDWMKRTFVDLERTQGVAYQEILNKFDSTWDVKGLIVTRSNLVTTWKEMSQMSTISWFPLRLC